MGALGNIWIIFVLTLGHVRISKTTKVYYLLIAVSDLSTVLSHLFWAILCDSLWILTNGRLFLCLDISSLFSCILMKIWYNLSELSSNYALVALSIERCIAICWPLKSKQILNQKFTYYLLFICIVPVCIYYLGLIPFSSAIVPFIRVPGFLCYIDDYNIFGNLFNVSMPILFLGLHSIIVLFITIILFRKLLYISLKKSAIIATEKASSREISTTVTLIFLCLINLVIYGTCLISYVATLVFSYIFTGLAGILAFSYIILVLSMSSTVVSHSLNSVVYLALIPSFRNAAFCRTAHIGTAGHSTLKASNK